MSKDKKKRGLGRGLSALMGETEIDIQNLDKSIFKESESLYKRIPIELLYPSPEQPRSYFDEKELDNLATSIAKSGIIQPLMVRPNSEREGEYQIIAGERRWRAAQRAGLHELPVIVRNISDLEALEIAIIENIQREDLNAIEEAEGYKNLIEKFNFTQEKLAKSIGKSRAHIANMLRLLSLPENVKEHVCSGALTMGHARALLASDDPSKFADIVMIRRLSVRETENLIKNHIQKKSLPHKQKIYKDADTKALESQISANIGLKVSINQKPGQKNGSVLISYSSFQELEGFVALLCKELA